MSKYRYMLEDGVMAKIAASNLHFCRHCKEWVKPLENNTSVWTCPKCLKININLPVSSKVSQKEATRKKTGETIDWWQKIRLNTPPVSSKVSQKEATRKKTGETIDWRPGPFKVPISTVSSKRPSQFFPPPTPVRIVSELEIVETEKKEEYFEKDLKSTSTLIDNAKSSATATRTISITKQWSRSYVLEKEEAQTDRGELNIGPIFANVKKEFEKATRAKYSLAEETRLTYTDEVKIEVPPYKKVRLFINWKRVWQHGLAKFKIRFSDQKIREVEEPFRIVVGLKYDQKLVDEK